MKYNKLLTLSLISTMTAATLMFTGCGEDKKTTAENTKVEKTQKEDTSNETTASEEVEEVRYNEEGYRIFDTFNGNLNEVDVGEIVWDEGEGCYLQYQGDGCWMYNPFDEDTVTQTPVPDEDYYQHFHPEHNIVRDPETDTRTDEQLRQEVIFTLMAVDWNGTRELGGLTPNAFYEWLEANQLQQYFYGEEDIAKYAQP